MVSRHIKFRLTDVWMEEWYNANKNDSNMSQMIRNSIRRAEDYPDNVDEIMDRLVKVDRKDFRCITEYEFHYIIDLAKALARHLPDFIKYDGEFLDTNVKKPITLENFASEDDTL